MARKRHKLLHKSALRVEQNQNCPLYLLSLTAEEILAVSDISRLARSEGGKLLGYQRGEVRRHIQDIVAYLQNDDILLPNSIIIAFSSQVGFRAVKNADDRDELTTAGTLTITVPSRGQGQTRLDRGRPAAGGGAAAVASERTGRFPSMRSSRMRWNSSATNSFALTTPSRSRGASSWNCFPRFRPRCPGPSGRRSSRPPLCDLLNRDPASPFHGLIRRASTPAAYRKTAVVADASVIKMLEESLTTPAGCLFPYHNLSTAETDIDCIWAVLPAYWSAVRVTFPEAWGKPPAQSRLMHGTGLRAMGRLMDRVAVRLPSPGSEPSGPAGAGTTEGGPHLPLDFGPLGRVGIGLAGDPECPPAPATAFQPPGAGLPASTGRWAMKFFFPDSQDLVDPSFDFHTETRSDTRVRQRDDQYPHEVFASPPYDGMLVSKGIVDGTGGDGGSRYTLAQRHRLLREGVRSFFRLGDLPLETMGDCGAFSYVREERPPFTVQEVIDFYVQCGFDYGLSVDHVILALPARTGPVLPGLDVVPEEWRRAAEDHSRTRRGVPRPFRRTEVPLHAGRDRPGVEPGSYAAAVEELQKLGYRYIALGGMVPLKTPEILSCLQARGDVLRPETRMHLLGVTRLDSIQAVRGPRRGELRQHVAAPAGVQGRQGQLLHPGADLLRHPRAPGRGQRQDAQPHRRRRGEPGARRGGWSRPAWRR